MKNLNGLFVASALILASTVASPALADPHFTPVGSFQGHGTIRLQTPATFQQTIVCNISIDGSVNPVHSAKITSARFAGSSPFCSLLVAKSLSWPMYMDSQFSGGISEMGLALNGTSSNCGINTIRIQWNNATSSFNASNQSLSGYCKLISLDVVISPQLMVVY
ncbi:MAG: alkane oxidation protein activator PraB [Pseudomonas protegens]|uniref:alkane oxidation protein activator PraB n=1 Tax=Pseudomonas protegens TaxID=380021 RepID=UPI00383AEC56